MEKKLNVSLFWSNVSLTASVLDAQQFSFVVAPGSVSSLSPWRAATEKSLHSRQEGGRGSR